MTANNSHGSAHRCLLFLAHTAGVAKQTRTQFSHESQYLVFNDHNSTVFRQASGHIVMQRGSGAACQEEVGSQRKQGVRNGRDAPKLPRNYNGRKGGGQAGQRVRLSSILVKGVSKNKFQPPQQDGLHFRGKKSSSASWGLSPIQDKSISFHLKWSKFSNAMGKFTLFI